MTDAPPDREQTSSPAEEPDAADGSDAGDDSTFETWLVRFFLVLVFGVAFGIEGRTLIRTYLESDTDDPAAEAEAVEERRVGEGDALVEGVPATVRATRLLASASGDWTYRLTVAPGSLSTDTLAVTINRLTTNSGDALSSTARRTWAPGDTTALTTTWSIPAGQQPASLHVTTRHATPETTRTAATTVKLAKTPVQMGD